MPFLYNCCNITFFPCCAVFLSLKQSATDFSFVSLVLPQRKGNPALQNLNGLNQQQKVVGGTHSSLSGALTIYILLPTQLEDT